MPDQLGAYRGKDAPLYYNSGTRASPTWVRVPARDKNMPISWGEADVSTDETDFKMMLKTLAEVGIDFQMVKDISNTAYTALWNAALSATTAIEFALMNGDIATTGNRGVRFFGQVFSATDNAALEDGQLVDFSVKPTRWIESDALAPPLPYTVA